MTLEEMHENSASFIAAGSETTSTLLGAAIFHLLTKSDCYNRIVDKVRRQLGSAQDIDLHGIGNPECFQAAVSEAFRIFPPAPSRQLQISPVKGDTLSGYWVPPGVS